MEIVLGVTEARKDFSELVEKVQYQGDAYMINRHGKPAAALVPVQVYEDWKKEQEKLFQTIREVQSNAYLEADEAEKLAAEALAALREEQSRQ